MILALFLVEAVLLATAAGAAGVIVGMGLARTAQLFLPGLPVETPVAYGVSIVVGLVSCVLPARRAAALDPIDALRAG